MIKTRITEIPPLSSPAAEGLPDLSQSRYKFNSSIFPADLGRSDQGHYMIININVQTKNGTRELAGTQVDKFYNDPNGKKADNLREPSKIDKLRFGTQGNSGGVNRFIQNLLPFPYRFVSSIQNLLPVQSGGPGQVAVAVPRTTTRIAESIAMHMPTPLVFNTQNVYEEVSLTALAGKLGIKAASFVGGMLPGEAGKYLGNIVSGAGQLAGQVLQLAQSPINPMVEILFSNVVQRQFTFELLLAPRNEDESNIIKNIIKTLRFHAAPEVGSLGGLLWIPPDEFDITFYNKGTENPHLLRINTCVLERIEVDYAPTSGIYSTFRNGHPVAVRLSLGFRELEPLHKERIRQGF